MNTIKAAKIFERFAQTQPAPSTELQYQNPYELLVAVILSAQATDKSVNKVTPALFKAAPGPKQMVKLGYDRLETLTRQIGLFRTKTRNILAMSQILIDQYDSQVPNTRSALESLPGVGRKTANIILNQLFNIPAIAVDTHVFRIANRIGLTKGKNVREVEDQLMKIVPENEIKNVNHWLVLHGRYVCKARKPECQRCIIVDLCEFPDKLV